MGSELNAVIGKLELLKTVSREYKVPVAVLNRGFGLIPLTVEIINSLIGNNSPFPVDYQKRQRRLDDVIKEWSVRASPIIHALNETHAGPGEQRARIFQDGMITFAQKGSPYSGPISMALQRLGVTGGALHFDEFELVGLTWHRKTSSWLDAALDQDAHIEDYPDTKIIEGK